MDFIAELLFEILGEGALELIQNKKVPFIIRAIIFIIMSAIYLSIIALMIYFTIKNNSQVARVILILLELLLFGLYLSFIYKLIKERE